MTERHHDVNKYLIVPEPDPPVQKSEAQDMVYKGLAFRMTDGSAKNLITEQLKGSEQ